MNVSYCEQHDTKYEGFQCPVCRHEQYRDMAPNKPDEKTEGQ